jgi:hypothetical protein
MLVTISKMISHVYTVFYWDDCKRIVKLLGIYKTQHDALECVNRRYHELSGDYLTDLEKNELLSIVNLDGGVAFQDRDDNAIHIIRKELE